MCLQQMRPVSIRNIIYDGTRLDSGSIITLNIVIHGNLKNSNKPKACKEETQCEMKKTTSIKNNIDCEYITYGLRGRN